MSDKPTIPEVLPLAEGYYECHPTGGSLHIVLDDGNLEDDDVDFCIKFAIEQEDVEGERLARLLRQMSKTQRRKIMRSVR